MKMLRRGVGSCRGLGARKHLDLCVCVWGGVVCQFRGLRMRLPLKVCDNSILHAVGRIFFQLIN